MPILNFLPKFEQGALALAPNLEISSTINKITQYLYIELVVAGRIPLFNITIPGCFKAEIWSPSSKNVNQLHCTESLTAVR